MLERCHFFPFHYIDALEFCVMADFECQLDWPWGAQVNHYF